MIKHTKRVYLQRRWPKQIHPVRLSHKGLRHLNSPSPRLQSCLRFQSFSSRLRRTFPWGSYSSNCPPDGLQLELRQLLAASPVKGSWWQELITISWLILFGAVLLKPLLFHFALQEPVCLEPFSCAILHQES